MGPLFMFCVFPFLVSSFFLKKKKFSLFSFFIESSLFLVPFSFLLVEPEKNSEARDVKHSSNTRNVQKKKFSVQT